MQPRPARKTCRTAAPGKENPHPTLAVHATPQKALVELQPRPTPAGLGPEAGGDPPLTGGAALRPVAEGSRTADRGLDGEFLFDYAA